MITTLCVGGLHLSEEGEGSYTNGGTGLAGKFGSEIGYSLEAAAQADCNLFTNLYINMHNYMYIYITHQINLQRNIMECLKKQLHLYKLELFPHDALFGCGVEVPTLEGPVILQVPPKSSSGRLLRLKGRGLKYDDLTGDQIVITEGEDRYLDPLLLAKQYSKGLHRWLFLFLQTYNECF